MDLVDQYLSEMERAIRLVDRDAVRNAVAALFAAWLRGGTAFVLGNGGSAATASHMMVDLNRCTVVPGCRRFRALALTDNVATLTAIANDLSYEEIFVEQLRDVVGPQDVVVALSGSGNSRNVVRAIEYAAALGVPTVGLCGDRGGKLAGLVDIAVRIPAARIGQQEDGHLVLNHAIALALREKIAATLPAGALSSV